MRAILRRILQLFGRGVTPPAGSDIPTPTLRAWVESYVHDMSSTGATAPGIALAMDVSEGRVRHALLQLEKQGRVMRNGRRRNVHARKLRRSVDVWVMPAFAPRYFAPRHTDAASC